MPRRSSTALAILAAIGIAAASAGAAAQDAGPGTGEPLDRIGRVDAVEYMRGLIENDRYDPRDRERALNGARDLGSHWQSSIFDGRRTRATRGTGLRLPDILPDDDE